MHLRDAGNRATTMRTPTPTPAAINGPPGGKPLSMAARNRASSNDGAAAMGEGTHPTSTGGGGVGSSSAAGVGGSAPMQTPSTPEALKLQELVRQALRGTSGALAGIWSKDAAATPHRCHCRSILLDRACGTLGSAGVERQSPNYSRIKNPEVWKHSRRGTKAHPISHAFNRCERPKEQESERDFVTVEARERERETS